jgi:FG-GAP repeat protein
MTTISSAWPTRPFHRKSRIPVCRQAMRLMTMVALSLVGVTVSACGNGDDPQTVQPIVARLAQQAYVTASNPEAGDDFGESVTLSADGTTLAVAAHNEASNATGIEGNQADNTAPNAGAVYVFVRSGGLWSQQAYLKASNTEVDDIFGQSVALNADGTTLAVAALWERSNATGIGGNQADNSAPLAGAVYVYD